MHEDFEYVKSLEKEIDELESEKADFSNMYDLLLEECVSKDVNMFYILHSHSLSELNAHTELQMHIHLDSFLRSKDETPEVLKDFLTMSQRNLPSSRLVERRNRTLVEAARTMLSASKLPLSFWAEAVATACYTQNRSIIISTHGNEQSTS
ncbi:retrovirus-related pol polyprotein from transposon TNT 1-94 [Tanacetum coccineum]